MDRDMYDMWGKGMHSGDQEVPLAPLMPPGEPLPMPPGMTFARRGWDPGLYAQTVLAQFGACGWMDRIHANPPNLDPAVVADELDQLGDFIKDRPGRAAEIQAQARDASVYWQDMLMASPASHPFTWGLIATGNTVAHMVAMHFKLVFKRPRPIQLYPSLMPPLLTPPHPSYPNAHALEALVMSACAAIVAPQFEPWLLALARRIGENREYAGVHYPSDRKESEHLAPQIMAVLNTLPLFQDLVVQAKAEWPAA